MFKKNQGHRICLQVAEIHMLRYMNGVSWKGRIRNDDIRGTLGVADIRYKMTEYRLRDEEDLIRAFLGRRVNRRQGRGRPKLTWEQVIQADMMSCRFVDPSLSPVEKLLELRWGKSRVTSNRHGLRHPSSGK